VALIPGTTFDDSLTGGSGADTLTGDLGNDTLDGGAGTDSLSGGDGNDVLVQVGPASGAEVFDGGLGFDTLRLLSNGVTVASPNGPLSSIGLLSASFSGMEAIEFTSTSGTAMSAQMFIFQAYGGFGGTLALTGGAGVDTLFLGASLGGQYQMPNFTFSNWTNTPGGPNDIVVLSAMNAQDYTFYGRDGLGVIQALVGNGGSDFIEGSDGADVIIGNGGNDTLDGDSGNDTLTGGAGADVFVLSGTGQKIITDFNVAEDKFSPGGFDNFTSLQPYLSEVGGNAVFSITYGGTLHTHTFQGVPLASLTASNFVYETVPVEHNDTGSGLADVVRGGAGNDVEDGGAGDDTVYGFAGNDWLLGGGGNDSILGGSGNDTLDGGAGADTLVGGTGADSISGGAGADLAIVSPGAGQTTIVSLGTEADTLRLAAGMAAGSSVIVTDFQTGAGGDALSLDAFLAANAGWTPGTDPFAAGLLRLSQNGADAILELDADGAGPGGFATVTTFAGTSALNFTAANLGGYAPQAVTGGAGSDILAYTPPAATAPGATAPVLDGGAGVDTLTITAPPPPAGAPTGTATIKPSPDGLSLLFDLNGDGVTDLTVKNVEDIVLNGDQVVISGNLVNTGLAPNTIVYNGTAANNLLDAGGLISVESIKAYGGDGNDTLITANDDDLLVGGAGNDSLSARGGPDSLDGGAGDDRLLGGDGADTLDGGTGTDTLDGGADDDLLSGSDGADSLIGGNGLDRLYGGQDADVLDGGNGQDTLDGGTGDDVLRGGGGADFLTGGAGADRFEIDKSGGTDRIFDFTAGDKLVFVGGSGTVAFKAMDLDGDGKVDDLLVSVSKGGFSVELIDVTTLSASDWIFA
jgi:Ca2+-binding RTX toxin-like protein